MLFGTFLLFANLGSALFAQNNTLRFSSYTIADGLSQSLVTCVTQDKLGYMWIGTQDGLNRFDGRTFKVYQNQFNDSTSLSNNYITCIEQDNKGDLWIGTELGINKLDPEKQEISRYHFPYTKPLNSAIINDIAIQRDGKKLFIATKKKGLYILKPDAEKCVKISAKNLPESNFTHLAFNQKNQLLIGSENNGVRLKNKNQFQEIYFPPNVSVNGIFNTKNKKTYFPTDRGIYKLHGAKAKALSQKLSKFNCQDILLYDDHAWIATYKKGLVKYNLNTQQYRVFNKDNNTQENLVSNYINTFFLDFSGVIWLGTEKGLSKFDLYKQAFNYVSKSDNPKKGLLDENVWCFAEQNDNLWIGTKTAVSKYDRTKNKFIHYSLPKEPKEDNRVHKIYVQDSNKIWLATAKGLLLLNPKTGKFQKIQYKDKIENEKVYSIKLYDNAKLLIAAESGIGWYDINTKKYKFKKQKPGNSLGNGGVKSIFQSKGKWYIITSTEIFNVDVDNQNKIITKKAFENIHKKNRVYANALQVRDTLWLGTYGSGLLKYNLSADTLLKHYTKASGLPNNVIYSILSDQQENIWVSTNRGLAKIKGNSIKKFTQNDGLQSNEFNSGSSLKATKNILYFGGINGYNWFNPKDVKPNTIPPKTVIEHIEIFNKDADPVSIKSLNQAISSKEHITLEYEQNSLTFHLASLHFSNPIDNKFKFKLKGIDENFRTTSEPSITYTALPPGEYTFIAYSSNPDGYWSESVHLNILIQTPFWATWWFRGLIIILVAVIIIYAYRKRIDNIRRQKIRLELNVVESTRELREESKKVEKQKQEVEEINKKMKDQNNQLEKEKEKVEQLLLNVLPEDTARELRDKGKARARDYKKVSIMFTDFVGFTKKSDDYKPSELVEKLDNYFSRFDKVIEKYNLEKIKTIGDAYMCAGGIPIRNKTNAIETVLAGLEIQNIITGLKKANQEGDDPIWDIRVGINTGEVVAGVIGSKRFAYDIWGQAVNIANRMEMHSEPGKVNVSEQTFEYIEPYFECTYRGKIRTKSSGYTKMYFVNRIKAELSKDDEGIVPNKKFWKIVELHNFSSINYMKAERYIMKELEKKLSPDLHYHSIDHTKDVTNAAERLAIKEGITDEALFLLKSAATYHDAGFVEQYDHNEPIGVRMSREILPKYGYTDQQIETIAGMIYATKVPHKPQTHLQEIICDADLDYLGRDDFHEIADRLRRELREHGKINSDRQWDEIQLQFLRQHKYFTKSAIDMRQELKDKHIEDVKKRLKENNYKD